MLELEGRRYRLAIPLRDAIRFALGQSDLGYSSPRDTMRKLIGYLAADELEYSEQWRAAAMLRACLAERWLKFGRASRSELN